MDIEKLKAIIRLANNNPNDNEANLAARKACKILAEDDFRALNQANTITSWKDIKRSTEPAWRSEPYGAQGSPEARAYQEDWFRKWNAYWSNAEKEPTQDKTAWDGEVRYNPFVDKPKKESRTKKCSRCGVEVSTFRFKEEPFVCTVCHWKDLL